MGCLPQRSWDAFHHGWVGGHLNGIVLCDPRQHPTLSPPCRKPRLRSSSFPCPDAFPHAPPPPYHLLPYSRQAGLLKDVLARSRQPGLQRPLLIPQGSQEGLSLKRSHLTVPLQSHFISHILFIPRAHFTFSDQRSPQEALAGFSLPRATPTLSPPSPQCFDVVKQPLMID